VLDKKIGLKELWESLTFHQDYKDLTARAKRQYGRDEYYSYLESTYKVEKTKQLVKYIVGLERKDNENENLN
jgi:hypothetical protein